MFSSIPVVDPLPLLLAAAAGGSGRKLFGIAAEPGAGKTTLASQLCADVNAAYPGSCVSLSMDGFHLARVRLSEGVAGRSAEESHRRRGAPWTFDPVGLCAKLRAVRAASGAAVVRWPAFDHAKKDPEEDAEVVEAGARVVIVEGLYLLHRADGWEELEGLLDVSWYLGTPFQQADARLLARHQKAWGITEQEARQRISENDGINSLLCRASIPRASGIVLSRE